MATKQEQERPTRADNDAMRASDRARALVYVNVIPEPSLTLVLAKYRQAIDESAAAGLGPRAGF